MKVSELTGAQLDYCAGKAEGLNPVFRKKGKYADGSEVYLDYVRLPGVGLYSPSTDWAQGGPIIEREEIELVPRANGEQWSAGIGRFVKGGDTALIAAMRAYVAANFGEEVPDE